MPFEARIARSFCASHQVTLYDGQLEPLHGHNWDVTVTVSRPELDDAGFVVDFHQLQRQLDTIIASLNNRHLNDTDLLSRLNPSAENVAYAIGQALNLPDPVRLVSVSVTEAPRCEAIYRP